VNAFRCVNRRLIAGVVALLVAGIPAAAVPPAFPVADTPKPLTPLMERELRGCFDFFWNEWMSDPKSPCYGLTGGDYVGLGFEGTHIPIESQGFYFAVVVIGVERGWITKEEGRERVLVTLRTIEKLKNINGFYYHFVDPKTGRRAWNDSPGVELSNATTGTMLMGALVAGEYFGGEVRALAEALYARTNWKWFTNPKTKHPYLACFPEEKPPKPPADMDENGFFGGWSTYAEHLFLYILGAGAPNPEFATGAESYYDMAIPKGQYKGEPFIYCGTGAAFTYQWTHCFIDFRNMVDKRGINWFENSRHAATAARQYAIDKADEIKGLGPNSWGLSACISPSTGYSGHYGYAPFGTGHKPLNDGTIAPYASSAFVVFTPKASIAALEHMVTIPGMVGKYGLYDAYSYITKNDGDRPWTAKSYLGIDKGLVAPMFENYSSQLIWKLMHRSPHIQRGLKVLGFRHVERGGDDVGCEMGEIK